MGIASGTRTSTPARRRTTLALPAELLDAVDREVEAGHAESRAAVVVEALERELRRRRRDAIDANLRQMAHDPGYLAEQQTIISEFAGADAETARGLPR
jgi:Arc/MetJ-type ribon-helix-helix transcriptional regulator